MIVIAGQIIDRNSGPPDIKITQDIDTRLDELEAIMPPGWWQLPQESVCAISTCICDFIRLELSVVE